MAHSIELLFDDRTETDLRRCWDRLAQAGLPSAAGIRAATNRPHVTLVAAEHIDAAVDEMLAGFTARLPMPCLVGAPLLFGRRQFVLARLVVPSVDLLDLHRDIAAAARAHVRPGMFAHSDPGSWTPHCTLARRFRPDQLPAALEMPEVGALLQGSFVALRRWDGDARTDTIFSA